MSIMVGNKCYHNLNLSYDREKGFVVMMTYEENGHFCQPIYLKKGKQNEAIDYLSAMTNTFISNIRFWETQSLTAPSNELLEHEASGIDIEALDEMDFVSAKDLESFV